MKLDMKSTNGLVVMMLAIGALAAAFWILALSPKREEAKKLGAQVEEAKASLAQHRAEAAQALEARRNFPVDYQQLVVLGKAVPGGDETASLLVQLNQIADHAGVTFSDFKLEAGKGGEAAPAAPAPAAPAAPTAPEGGAATPASNPVSPTEAAASLLPLGATIGPAGLAVMPYSLTFEGDFFKIADFIKGLDSLVKTQNARVSVDGRLITINGFSLAPDPKGGFPALQATFSVTTYLTPPSQGVTAGATPAAPAPAAATPASTTTGGAP
jgi:Tfp pilus assembly protein PilO